jgi:hypothetical protein
MLPVGHTANIDHLRTPVLLKSSNGGIVRKADGCHGPRTPHQCPATDIQQSCAPGAFEKFHLGLAADGMACAQFFVARSPASHACRPEPLHRLADAGGAETARRRATVMPDGAPSADDDQTTAFNVASSTASSAHWSTMGGLVIPIRMRSGVANEMTRNMPKTVRVVSAC